MDTSEPTFEDSVASVVGTLPEPIRVFITGSARDQFLRLMTDRYKLRVDEADAFAKSFLLLLMGLQTPGEFAEALQQVGLSLETIAAIAGDVNTLVLDPLRKQMQEPVAAPVTPTPSSTAPLPPKPASAPAQAIPSPLTMAKTAPPPGNLPGMLADYEVPHINVPAPRAPMPTPSPLMAGPSLPRPQNIPKMPAQPPQSPPPQPPSYSADPYREPIE